MKYSNVTYWYFGFILTAMNRQSKRLTWPVFHSGPRTDASGENASRPTTGLQKSQKWSDVSRGKQLLFFSKRADLRYSKARLQKVSRKHLKIWLRTANVKYYLSPKVGPILKLSNSRRLRKVHTFPHKLQMSTLFLRDGPWKFADVFYISIPRPDLRFFYFFRWIYLV